MSEPLVVLADGDPRDADLAARLGLPLVEAWDGLALRHRDGRLELVDLGPGAPGPLVVDAVDGELGHRLRQGPRRDEDLARAVGVKRHGPRPVFDATPGLGRDLFVLAGLGCEVHACERQPVVVELLRDGLARAAVEPRLEALVGRVTLSLADAGERLPTLETPPGVVLIDPMFPGRKGSALVRKEMRLLRRAVGDDVDAPGLLATALAVATERVVVRRPAGAPPLDAGRAPDLDFGGRRTRLDVYLR